MPRNARHLVEEHAHKGLRIPEICQLTGLCAATVATHLKSLGVPAPRSRLAKHLPEIAKMYASGQTIQQIADHFGEPQKTVNKAMKAAGIPRRRVGPKSGSEHPQWKGGRFQDDDGYILVYAPNHPFCRKSGYILEHRLVMEGMVRRFLLDEEVVHHKNDVRNDNRPDNLELFSCNADHLAETLKGKCPKWTPEGYARVLENCRKNASDPARNTKNRLQPATDAGQ